MLGVDVLDADEDAGGEGNGSGRAEGKKVECLRFCTTHLESLAEEPGFELRPKQLAVISALLKEQTQDVEIVGGLVGGDMNAILRLITRFTGGLTSTCTISRKIISNPLVLLVWMA